MDINRAQTFFYQNVRPLDLARWQYLFGNAKAGWIMGCYMGLETGSGAMAH